MIRDLGSTVEFWFKAGYTNDWWNGLKFSWTANGTTTDNISINYPTGAQWKKVGSRTVTSSTTVTFRLLTQTGTNGMGGPTTFSITLNRAKVPDPPSGCSFSSLTGTSVHVTFTDGSNNGAAIDARQIGYGTSSTSTQGIVSSDRSTTITGLTPGRKYYFWARTHNSEGWSAWGPRREITTPSTPSPPAIPTMSLVTQITAHVKFKTVYDGGSPYTAYQLGYGKNPTFTDVIVSASPYGTNLVNLDPGSTYYIWARARNAYGWSAWGPRGTFKTVAGARLKVGTVWKEAVPYMKVDGVWKVVRPWSRRAGVWKESQ